MVRCQAPAGPGVGAGADLAAEHRWGWGSAALLLAMEGGGVFKLNLKQVCLHLTSVAPYLRKPRLKALLLRQRGRSQSRVGGTEEVARVHIEGWNLSCRT